MVDLNKQKSLFFMELFLYLIFLDLDKIDVYRDKSPVKNEPYAGQGFPQQGNLRFFRPFHFLKLVNLDLNLPILVL